MSARASPLKIGVFVVVGVVLLIVGLVILGAGRLFRDTVEAVLYFDDEVNGLNVGSAVKFKGIPVGSVTHVGIRSTRSDGVDDVRIQVVISVDRERIAAKGASIDLSDPDAVRDLVDRGLRASLAIENLLTGLRYVELDIAPGTPANLVADPAVDLVEIPVIPGWGEQFQQDAARIASNLADVELEALVRDARALIADARALVDSPELRRAITRFDRVTAELDATLADARRVIAAYGQEGEVGRDLGAAAQDARAALASVRRLVRPDGAFTSELEATLSEVQDAARSLRQLTDKLSRDPGALIRGGSR